MNYSSMLDRLDWDFKNGKSDLGRLDRMLLVLRRNQSPDSNDEMGEFWAYRAQKNLYIAALLIKKAERAYGVDDFCVETGRTVIREHQKELLIDNQALWRLFAEIELGTNY